MKLKKQRGSSYDMEKTLLGPDETLLVIPIDCATSRTLFHLLGGLSHKLHIMGKQVPRLSSGISLVSRNGTIPQAHFNLSIPESALYLLNAYNKNVIKESMDEEILVSVCCSSVGETKAAETKMFSRLENTCPGDLSLSVTENPDDFFKKLLTHLVQEDTLKPNHRQGDYCQESVTGAGCPDYYFYVCQPAPSLLMAVFNFTT